jgi:hypothetical protein
MANKAKRLIAKAVASARKPKPAPERPIEKPGYRVVAVSLYSPEAEWIDRATQLLRSAGNPKANRSLVVREAILRLQEELAEKNPQEILRDFTERQAKRSRVA